MTEYQRIDAGGSSTTIPNFFTVSALGETPQVPTLTTYQSTLPNPNVQLRVFSETKNDAGLVFRVTVYACLAQDITIRSTPVVFTVTTASAQIVESASTFTPSSP